MAGLEPDDGGGGMRKGMAPDEDVEGVDDIRTMGNDGVWGRNEFVRDFDGSV